MSELSFGAQLPPAAIGPPSQQDTSRPDFLAADTTASNMSMRMNQAVGEPNFDRLSSLLQPSTSSSINFSSALTSFNPTSASLGGSFPAELRDQIADSTRLNVWEQPPFTPLLSRREQTHNSSPASSLFEQQRSLSRHYQQMQQQYRQPQHPSDYRAPRANPAHQSQSLQGLTAPPLIALNAPEVAPTLTQLEPIEVPDSPANPPTSALQSNVVDVDALDDEPTLHEVASTSNIAPTLLEPVRSGAENYFGIFPGVGRDNQNANAPGNSVANETAGAEGGRNTIGYMHSGRYMAPNTGHNRSGSGNSSVEAIGGSAVIGMNESPADGSRAVNLFDTIVPAAESASAVSPSNILGKRDRGESVKPGTKGKRGKCEDVEEAETTSSDENCCPICFEQWTSDGDHRLVCLSCGHLFGRKCVAQWLKRTRKCPTCKKKANTRDMRVLFGVPSKLSTNNSKRIDALEKQLAKERKSHGDTKTELQVCRNSLAVFRLKVREMQRHVKTNSTDDYLAGRGWPSLNLVTSIETTGRSKAFDISASGTFVFAQKAHGGSSSQYLCYSHLLQSHVISHSSTVFPGFISDIKANNNISSHYHRSVAVVSADRHLRLIDGSYNMALYLPVQEIPMSVSWVPGCEHQIAVGTLSGEVKFFDARFPSSDGALHRIRTCNNGGMRAVSPGIHSLATHENSQTLVAASSSTAATISMNGSSFSPTSCSLNPIRGDCCAGLAISNDLLVLSSRRTDRCPAVIECYPSLHFGSSLGNVDMPVRKHLGDPFGPPLRGHMIRRPFVRCTALVAGGRGEGGAVVATADDTRLDDRFSQGPSYRGVIWAARSINLGCPTLDWRMLRTRETFPAPLADFRSMRPPQNIGSDVSYIGMLCEQRLNIYRFGLQPDV